VRRDGRSQIEDVIWPDCVILRRRLSKVDIDRSTDFFNCDALVGHEVPERGIIWHHLRIPLPLSRPDFDPAARLFMGSALASTAAALNDRYRAPSPRQFMQAASACPI
jgi:hypothetical protein